MKSKGLVLSIFPGFDLLGRGFEEVGFTILRGPDLLWGGDIHNFHPPRNTFVGVIGGPPCQKHSQLAKFGNVSTVDLIPEFLRVVEEAQPEWAVMENVRGVLKKGLMPSDWLAVKIRDWDCGGFTFRTRIFWIHPPTLIFSPPKIPGKPQYSVLASSFKEHGSINKQNPRMHGRLSIKKAGELQGFPELVEPLTPLGQKYAIQLLGNGVTKAMGLYIARAIKGSNY